MGINDNAIQYKGYFYQAAIFGRDAVWVVSDVNETILEDGTIVNGTIQAAEQSARDYIDNILENPLPEIAEDETDRFVQDYTKSTCKAQKRSWVQPFIVMSSDGYFLQENLQGDLLRLDANDMVDMTLPEGYKMKINISFKGQEDFGFGRGQRTYDSATLYLEGGDSLSVSVLNDEASATLFQNGEEKINSSNLADYNQSLVRKTITLRMVSFEICTPIGGVEDDDFVQESEGFSLDNDMLLFLLGGLVLLIIAGYVLNTTSEVMSDG